MEELMGEALGESKAYKVLPPQEVDRLKKEVADVSTRIEATQRKLTLETKVRDASGSMGRLQRPGDANGTKRASQDGMEAARKCEQLGEELWQLEKQEYQLSTALLRHNAAVLQSTHKGYLKDKADGHDILSDYAASDDDDDDSGFGASSLTLDELSFGSARNTTTATSTTDTTAQNGTILEIGARVEELNAKIRQMLRDAQLPETTLPRQMQGDSTNSEELIHEQVDFMASSLDALQRSGGAPKGNSTEVRNAEDDLQDLNFRLFQTLSHVEPNAGYPEPPETNGESLSTQVEYLSKLLGLTQQQLDKTERYNSVISGLWNTLASPEEAGQFSLQRFSAKVQEMQIKFSSLQEAKDVLTRQIQQQRELNETSDHAKDARIDDLAEELDSTRSELDNAQHEANIHLEKLASAMEELELSKSRIAQNEQQRGLAGSQALESEKQARAHLEEQLQQLKEQHLAASQMADSEREAKAQFETQLQQIRLQHDTESQTAISERQARQHTEQQLEQLRAELAEKTAEAQKSDEAFQELEGNFVRTQTELVIAKADLDSAHGSRAERAAEKAADPVLQGRIQKLEAELSETISDYETMTKATIEYEKEREQMESTIDTLRDKLESLELQLDDERLNTLGAKSPGNSSDRGGMGMGTSAGILRSEFRKMMKEARAEHVKALRVSFTSPAFTNRS
jgi:DNA repair exonuclease SbcCD ATPase subunit